MGSRTTNYYVAYSLLGLFGVIMPLHYGEGPVQAFERRQLEINQNADESILAWQKFPDTPSIWGLRSYGLEEGNISFLASSPRYFRSRGHIAPAPQRINKPYSVTNVGLEIEVYLCHLKAISPYESTDLKGLEPWDSQDVSEAEGLSSLAVPFSRIRHSSDSPFPFTVAVIGCSSIWTPSTVFLSPLQLRQGGKAATTPLQANGIAMKYHGRTSLNEWSLRNQAGSESPS